MKYYASPGPRIEPVTLVSAQKRKKKSNGFTTDQASFY